MTAFSPRACRRMGLWTNRSDMPQYVDRHFRAYLASGLARVRSLNRVKSAGIQKVEPQASGIVA